MRRFFKGLLITVASIVVLVVLALVVIDSMNWNRWRGSVAELSKRYVGRELVIAGDLKGHILTLSPWVEAKDIHFENAPWAARKDMFAADRALVEIRLLPLLRGQIDLNRAELDAPDLQLEKNAKGQGNWAFSQSKPASQQTASSGDKKTPSLPLVRHVRIENAQFVYLDDATGKRTKATLSDLSTHEAGRDKPTTLTGHGSVDRLPFSLEGTVGSTAELAGQTAPYPFQLVARLAETSVRTEGEVQDLAQLRGLDADIHVTGKRLQELLAAFGIELSDDLPSYRLTGHIKADKDHFAFTKLDARLGGSRLTGSGSVRLGGERPALKADVTVPIFRWADVKGLVPKKAAAEAPGARKEEAEKTGEPTWVFSPKELPLAALKSVDADIQLKIQRLEGPGAAELVDASSVALTLKNGRLQLKPFDLALAGGHVTVDAVLNATQDPASLSLKTGIKQLNLQSLVTPFLPDKLVKPLKERSTEIVTGRLGGDIDLKTHGSSLRDFASNLNGEFGLAMEDGLISAPVSDLLPLDLTGAVQAFFARGKDTRVQCIISHFTAKEGVATPSPVLIATKDANTVLQGTANLKTEQLHLSVRTFPKQVGLGALKTPVDINGSFAHPKIELRKGPLALKALAAVGLGAIIGPAAALVPLIEPGLGDDGACARYAAEIAEIGRKSNKVAH